MAVDSLAIYPLALDAEVVPGDVLAELLMPTLLTYGTPQESDVLVVAQKIVSKSEDRFVDLNEVTPGALAMDIASTTAKDPRLVEVILSESTEVIRAVKDVLIVRHRSGLVMANAGIDRSNVPQESSRDWVLLLPEDADRSAERIQIDIQQRCGVKLGVIISDSFGRPWRQGVTNVAIGSAGVASLVDFRGGMDRHRRSLEVTQVATADALAAAAGLLIGEGAESVPAVLIRGWHCTADFVPASAIVRAVEEDLFR